MRRLHALKTNKNPVQSGINISVNRLKTVMQNPDNARAFFQHYLEPQWSNALDLDTLTLQSGSQITADMEALHIDILYRVEFCDPTTQGEAAYLYTLVEHQSTPDPKMALRLLQYKVNFRASLKT